MIYWIGALVAIAVSAIEAVSYSGFIVSHLNVNPFILYFISIFLAMYAKKLPKIALTIFSKLGCLVIIIDLILIFLETVNYPNYVFTLTHINPVTFQLFVSILWFHILISKGSTIVKSLLIAVLIFVGVRGMGATLGIVYNGIKSISLDPFASYSEKMTRAYPGVYPAMQEIIKLTPSSATILIPPQGNPWEVEGNPAMVTYFLYPRKVLNLDDKKIKELPDNTYILIAKGSWKRTGEMDYGWPKVSVGASRMWEINTINNTVTEYRRDYDPNQDKWDWGLIEVKK